MTRQSSSGGSFSPGGNLSSSRSVQSDASSMVTWATSPEHQIYLKAVRGRTTRRGWLATALAIVSGVGLAFGEKNYGYTVGGVIGLAVTVAIALWSMIPYWTARRAYFERVQAEKARAVEEALTRLEGAGPRDSLPLTALFIFNRRQLDEYQTLTKHHAAVSFRNAQVSAGIGFAVLIIGISLVFQRQSATAHYTIGGLSSLGTLLAIYLSRTYFQSHQEAMKQLAIYYEEPFLTSRALSAERIISKIPDLGIPASDANVAALIRRLLEPALIVPDRSEPVGQRELPAAPTGDQRNGDRRPPRWPPRRQRAHDTGAAR